MRTTPCPAVAVSHDAATLYKARPTGFEPVTLGSEDRCAIQLRHGRLLTYNKDLCLF
jgi:hypothetical protein